MLRNRGVSNLEEIAANVAGFTVQNLGPGQSQVANPYTTTRPAVNLGERQLFTQFEEPTTDEFLLADLKIEIDLDDGYFTQIGDHAPGFGTVDLLALSATNPIGGPLTQSVFRFDPEMPAYNLMNLRLGFLGERWDIALSAEREPGSGT